MVLSTKLWESWSEEVQTAYVYYVNMKEKDAVVDGKRNRFWIENAAVINMIMHTTIHPRSICL